MQAAAEIGLLTCSISISLQFMQGTFEHAASGNDEPQWTLPASRIARFEEISAACHAVLEHCGRSAATACLFTIWTFVTISLYLFEQMSFPEQPPQTSLTLAMPPHPLKISSITSDTWHRHSFKVPLALTALRELWIWLNQHYDENVHPDTFSAVREGILIFQTLEDLLDMKQLAMEAIQARASVMGSTGEQPPAPASVAQPE